MSEEHIILKQQLQFGFRRDELVGRSSADAIDLLVAIATAASEEEWESFAEADFALDSMPPVLLTNHQMQLICGGILPTAATLIGPVKVK